MADIAALSLLSKHQKKLSDAAKPPGNYDQVASYEQRMNTMTDEAMTLLSDVGQYMRRIGESIEQYGEAVRHSSKEISERMMEERNQRNTVPTGGSGGRYRYAAAGTLGRWSGDADKETSTSSASSLDLIRRLGEMERRKMKLEEAILRTKEIADACSNNVESISTVDLNDLKNLISDFAKDQFENRADEKKQRDDEKRKKEEEDRQGKEDEEKKRKAEEERLKKKEEERRKKEEEERLRKEEEEKRKKEEEEKRLKEEEEKRRREEVERRQKEEEERKRREQERLEAERRKREAIKKAEEERKWRLYPNNWDILKYEIDGGAVDGDADYHEGLRCVVSAVPGSIQQDDLLCIGSDEYDDASVCADGERQCGSSVDVQSKRGSLKLEAQMRVFIPYPDLADPGDEASLKVSVDGGLWKESQTLPPPQLPQGVRMLGTEIEAFERLKLVVVAKRRRQRFVVDKSGSDVKSTTDHNIRLFIQPGTVTKPTEMQMEVLPWSKELGGTASRQLGSFEKFMSASSLVSVWAATPTKQDMRLIISIQDSIVRTGSRIIAVSRGKGKDGQWKIAQFDQNRSSKNVEVILPASGDGFTVLQLEMSPHVTDEEVSSTAKAIYQLVHGTVACAVFAQSVDNPAVSEVRVVESTVVPDRIKHLERLGFESKVSNDFCIAEGQTVALTCSGNIAMSTGSKVQLQYFRYRPTLREVTLHVVDKYKQRDSPSYLGNLRIQLEDEDTSLFSLSMRYADIPITLPKSAVQLEPRPRFNVRFPSYLPALAKFIALKTTEDGTGTWESVLKNLDTTNKIKTLRRNAQVKLGNDASPAQIVETVIIDWMKGRPRQDDKVMMLMSTLKGCGLKSLIVDCEQLVAVHREKLSDKDLDDISETVSRDRLALGKRLGLSDDVVQQVLDDNPGSPHDQVFGMLIAWRSSDACVRLGASAHTWLMKHL